jgi:hypothetical protein
MLVLPSHAPAQVVGKNVLYTTDADFDQGTMVSVNHDTPFNDRLQLNSLIEPFPFINIAASGRGTVVRANTETGQIVGEYRTAPEGRGLNPSRTTVDLYGSVWTANRNEDGEIDGVPHGSAVKIGLVVGGTRVDGSGLPDPSGGYLAPPFGYNTCIDRNGDGLIRTSAGLGDILSWPDISDGSGGADGLVEDADDECILIYQRLYDGEQARHVSVDADNNVWVGGYPSEPRMFYKLDGGTGAILDSFDARDIGCGGYGGLIDGNGILWSVGGPLLRYDPVVGTGFCVPEYGYGLGIDTDGHIWMSMWEGGIVKIAPDGTILPGFPKHTYPTTSSTTSLTASSTSPFAPSESPRAASKGPAVQAWPRSGSPAAITSLPGSAFTVAPVDDWVQSQTPWTDGETVFLTIEDGSGVLYSDSQVVDAGGDFHFALWDVFDVQRGHVVNVVGGTTSKTHTVRNLFVDGVDVTADTVFGRADPGTSVDVWVDGDGARTVTADGSGNWTADFSGLTDLTYLSEGGSQESDGDGDSTYVHWASPRVQVAPDDDWVESSNPWSPGATISLTIEDGSGVLYSDSQTADTEGRFHFELWEVFDLQRGHVVTVSDGTTTKTHTVTNLFADGIDVTGDDVFGRADAGTDVDVWVHGNGGLTVTADGSGNWTADFTGITDLTYLSEGGSQQSDGDGDSTYVHWASPRFETAPVDDWVQSSSRWTAGATISLTIEDGSGVVYSDSQTVDVDGNFRFELWEVFDLQRGHVVTVSDGTTTKTHTVTNLFVDGIDVTADTVFGRADAGTSVDIWAHGDGQVTATADGSGDWLADFSGMTDLTYLSDGGSQQVDDDGDSTYVHWASPSFQVAPDHDWVESMSPWIPGATISLTIEDGSGVVYSDSQTSDVDGFFFFDLGGFDLQRGHVVTVSDGMTIKTHTVTNLFVDGIDVTGDDVFGRADAGTSIDVWVHGDGQVTVTADGSGNWTADFSSMTDLTYLSDGGSRQTDDDGDSTGVWWAGPRIEVAPDDDWIQSWSPWTPGATISLIIEDGSGVVYADSQTADVNGNFHFGLWEVFDLQRGHVVTVSDGTTTKTHTVTNLFVDGVDVAADTVFGRADAGTDVDVWVHGDGQVTVTADGSGNWTADYSGIHDLTYLSDGGSRQTDDDGDSTGVWWASPSFEVSPDQDWIQSWNRWTPEATISLTIEDGSGVVYSGSLAASSNGEFHINVGAEGFDLLTGHVVTVSDGTTTKTHTVIDVTVSSIDTAADQVHGVANPGARVRVWVSLFDEGSGRWVTADLGGNWMADFSVPAEDQPVYDITDWTFVDVDEFDDDGDATWRRFGPQVLQNRGVAVTPSDNHVWVANSGVGSVTRLDNDGNVIKVIDTGVEPTGVAVDAAGKVWATNMGSNNAVRIDPNAGADGLGAVDLTVDLGLDAGPYNYSDMTGAVAVGSTSPQGFWTVVQDSQSPGFQWGRITWNTEPEGSEPAGTQIVVEARAADTEAGLGGQSFQPVANGALFSLFGRYIEARVTLKASADGISPVLSDIRIQPAYVEVAVDIRPGSCPNPLNVREKGVLPAAIVGTGDLDVTHLDPATITLVGVSPLRWSVEDSAIPYEPYLGKRDAYDCIEYSPGTEGAFDRIPDLTLQFDAREVVAALGDVSDGQVLALELEGNFLDEFGGGPILGEDVIIIIEKGKD